MATIASARNARFPKGHNPLLLGVCFFFTFVFFAGPRACLGQDITSPRHNSTSDEKKQASGPQNSRNKSQQNPAKYDFTIEHSIEHTGVKTQDHTGTCWSFATASFIESELIRRGKGQHDLSEMFIVKNVYRSKVENYVLRKGKTDFSEGALAHDFLNSAQRYGLVPEKIYDGRKSVDLKHDHSELEAVMKGFLDAVVERSQISLKWKPASNRILDVYLGRAPKRFKYRDRSYSPLEFSGGLEFRADDYVSITSFNHHPFYEDFVLEVPDNFSNGSFYNLPIKDLTSIIDQAIKNGFSIVWDGDVSERGFSSSKGIAVLPKDSTRMDLFARPGKEIKATQLSRQKSLMTLQTTDDHLMHLVGISRDTAGNKYYVAKNSWGATGEHKGFIHMSQAYIGSKTIAITVHKDAMPPRLKRK